MGMGSGSHQAEDAVRPFYAAFHAQDRAAAEALLGDDFTFTSPYDDHIGRDEFFRRCWPNAGQLRNFRLLEAFGDADEYVVLYECERTADGVRFRNCERLRIVGGRVREAEVFFGRER